MSRYRYSLITIVLITMLALTALSTQAQTEEDICFVEVEHCISGRIAEYWQQNGGLPVFGFPIGPQEEMTIEGQALQAQWFERNRLELHPENEPPYDVLLGRLGVDYLEQEGRDWQGFETTESQQEGCVYFEQTSQNVCGDILQMWQSNGVNVDGQPGISQEDSLALFGLPISQVITETINDQEYQVQWFERARFEMHPENEPPYNVLLGLLGKEVSGISVGDEETPTTEEETPMDEETPTTEEETPMDEETPTTEEETPMDEETPTTEEETPMDEEETPMDEEETPMDEEETPMDEEAETPMDEEETPMDEEAETPMDEEETP